MMNARCAGFGLATALTVFSAYAQPLPGAKPPKAAMFTSEAERCILPASQHHTVNPYILRAILKVESNLKPGAVGKNDNGTLDVGIGQMNSIHFRELGRHGVRPGDLKDACIGTYVAAWHLSKEIAKHGNTWFGIAAYHSATPYFNRRYQILLSNELIRSGVMQGKILPVPTLRPGQVKQAQARRPNAQRSEGGSVSVAQAPQTSVVFDAQ